MTKRKLRKEAAKLTALAQAQQQETARINELNAQLTINQMALKELETKNKTHQISSQEFENSKQNLLASTKKIMDELAIIEKQRKERNKAILENLTIVLSGKK